jgi:hypothetical protein
MSEERNEGQKERKEGELGKEGHGGWEQYHMGKDFSMRVHGAKRIQPIREEREQCRGHLQRKSTRLSS